MQSSSVKGAIMEKTGSAKKWLILIMLLASFSVTFMTRFVWSPLSSTIAPELGMTAAQAGSFMSAFFIGYVITQIPGGALADRLGVKFVLFGGILITGLASIAMSFANSYTMGFAIRVITGLGAGVVMSCCTKVISLNFEQSERGIAFGILLVGPTLGLMIANQLGAYFLAAMGWQAAFRAVGIIAIVIAALILLTIKNVKSEGIAEKVTLLTGIKHVFTTRNLLCVCLAGFLYMFLNLGVSTWANTYLNNIGYDTATAAGIMSIYSFGGIAGSLLTGFIVKKFNLSPKIYLIVVFALISATTILFGFQTEQMVLTAVACWYGFVSYLPNAHLNALTTKYAPKGLEGSVMGVQNCVFQLASILSPIVVGMTVDMTGAFQTCWITLAVVTACGIIFLALIRDSDDAARKAAKSA